MHDTEKKLSSKKCHTRWICKQVFWPAGVEPNILITGTSFTFPPEYNHYKKPQVPSKQSERKIKTQQRQRTGSPSKEHTMKSALTNVNSWNWRSHVIVYRYYSNTENLWILHFCWLIHSFSCDFSEMEGLLKPEWVSRFQLVPKNGHRPYIYLKWWETASTGSFEPWELISVCSLFYLRVTI